MVSLCPSLVIGPLLQSTLNASSSVIADCLKGDWHSRLSHFPPVCSDQKKAWT